jgi:hypothetical protein
VSTREFFAFWRGVEEVSGARDLGLRLGSEASPHQLDVASLAALHAPNLGEALKKLERYKRLVCPEEIGIEIVDGEARIRFEWTVAEEQVPLRRVEFIHAGVPCVGGNDTNPLARIRQHPNIESHARTVARRRSARFWRAPGRPQPVRNERAARPPAGGRIGSSCGAALRVAAIRSLVRMPQQC